MYKNSWDASKAMLKWKFIVVNIYVKKGEIDHTSWSSGVYPRNARILQYMQINQCDTPY